MKFEEYEKNAVATAIYPTSGEGTVVGLSYTALGLAGESGEVAEKIKKLIRDSNSQVTDEFKAAIVKELGDVLWYVTNLAREVGSSLQEVARKNNEKLAARAAANTLKGSGDDR